MKLIVCIDDNGGMAFNHRRQTKDVKQRQHMNRYFNGKTIRMSAYSYKLFSSELSYVNPTFGADYMSDIHADDFIFVERDKVNELLDCVDELYIYRWNRSYPDDVIFPLEELAKYELVGQDSFAGSSHDKIDFEIYKKICV